jgi:hypothetical protein
MTESDPGDASKEEFDNKVFWDDFYHHVDMLESVGIVVNQESLLNMPDDERKDRAIRLLGHSIFDKKPPEGAVTIIGSIVPFLDQHGFFPKGDGSDDFEDDDS